MSLCLDKQRGVAHKTPAQTEEDRDGDHQSHRLSLELVCVLRISFINWHDQIMCIDMYMGVSVTTFFFATSSAIVATQHNLKSCPVYQSTFQA